MIRDRCLGDKVMNEQKNSSSITITDVADALGISKTTVSRAISGKGRIGADTRQKVMDYIEMYNYKPNIIAKSLANSRTYNICVVLPGNYALVDLPYFDEAIVGIQEIAGFMDYDILLNISYPDDTSAIDRIISNHKVDGVILLRTFYEDAHIELLMEQEIPFITTGTSYYPGVKQVDYDHEGACCELTSVLLMRQFRKMALLGGNDRIMVNLRRRNGYYQAFKNNGIEADDSLVFCNLETNAAVENAVNIALQNKADCILCMDDGICSHVLRVLRQNHIVVPDQIRVASFYSSSVLENNLPSITSLEFDAREMGRQACRNLLAQIEGEETEECMLLPYKVVLRDSTK